MRIPKFVTGIIGLLYLNASSFAQKPSQTVILNYIKSKTLILYLWDDQKPDSIKEIKPSKVESATNNIIFGMTNNNRMDISAIFLSQLITTRNADVQFQEKVYDKLQKVNFPILLFFYNDVAINANQQFLRKNKIHHYTDPKNPQRQYVWPATYRAPELDASFGKRYAVMFGEYFNKDVLLMKEAYLDLLDSLAKGSLGQASQSIFKSQDAVSNIIKTDKEIPKLTSTQQTRWTIAETKQLGVIANDWVGAEEIGTAPVERKMYMGLAEPQVLNFWYPNVRAQDNKKAWKRTMIGTMKKNAEHFENDFVFPDHDIDFYVIPDKDYEYLIKENPPPNKTFLSKIGNLKEGEMPHCPAIHDHVEGEIDLADENEKQFLNFFNDQMQSYISAGFYGTWMYDRGHCDHPEIHPAEQIWWSNRKGDVYTYRCNLICDYSGRYNSLDQFDDEDDLGKYTIKKPWAAPPLKGVFALSFKLKPGQERLIYRIFQHDRNNVNIHKTVAFDNSKVHHYILNGRKVITVIEPVVECMKVSFEEVAFDAAGNLTGFIVLTSAVGKIVGSNIPEPGHLFFEVKRTVLKNAPAPGMIKVTLESVECLGVDDADNIEEIFGSINCKAFTVKDTISYRAKQLSANTTGTVCEPGYENLFCHSCTSRIAFKKNQKNPTNSSLIYDFPSEGFIEVTGDLDDVGSSGCGNRGMEPLGMAQKTYIMTGEIGATPYKFSQYFASGGTIIKANFNIQKVR